MSCEFYKELIFKKIDNETDDNQECVLFEHLKGCSQCREDLKNLLEIENILQNQELTDVPDTFSGAVINRISNPVKKRFFFKPVFTVAAACLILVLALYSNAFDTLLSSDTIVQKQGAGTQSQIQQGNDKEKQEGPYAYLAPYTQTNEEWGQKNSEASIPNQQQELNKDNQPEQKFSYRMAHDGLEQKKSEDNQILKSTASSQEQQTDKDDSLSQQQNLQPNSDSTMSSGAGDYSEITDDREEPQEKTFFGAAIMADPESINQSQYSLAVTITELKEKALEVLKKYTVIQISEFEYQLSKDEFIKLVKELEDNKVGFEIIELNSDSEIVLITIEK